ncbi:hypothetical protein [Streptomyces canus]|uniref:ATP-dependent DNA ligase n=1 Tax=Streptomyces canus TaxID=58343 RepID=UPI002E32EEA2|nr:hypothetical protein [Streptomyces canus]
MLTTPVSVPELRPGFAAEPKWDGFRALVSVDAGQVVLRSRRGTEMGPSFPEVVAGAVQLPDATAMDGELVVWDAAGRLAFERLQNRLARRGAGAARAAPEWPAHFVAFDLLRLSGTDTTRWPYLRRRAALANSTCRTASGPGRCTQDHPAPSQGHWSPRSESWLRITLFAFHYLPTAADRGFHE